MDGQLGPILSLIDILQVSVEPGIFNSGLSHTSHRVYTICMYIVITLVNLAIFTKWW